MIYADTSTHQYAGMPSQNAVSNVASAANGPSSVPPATASAPGTQATNNAAPPAGLIRAYTMLGLPHPTVCCSYGTYSILLFL